MWVRWEGILNDVVALTIHLEIPLQPSIQIPLFSHQKTRGPLRSIESWLINVD